MKKARIDQPLFDTTSVRDSCGFGLIVDQKNNTSHEIIKTAVESLCCMTHRGAVASDDKTGDGCGLLLKFPTRFFLDQLPEPVLQGLIKHVTPLYQTRQTFSLTHGKAKDEQAMSPFPASLSEQKAFILNQQTHQPGFAVGMLFLNPDQSIRDQHMKTFERLAESFGFQVIYWRRVPTSTQVLGAIAKKEQPVIIQPYLVCEDLLKIDDVNRRLYCLRRKFEYDLKDEPYFYVASLSCSVVSYKALAVPSDLPRFYHDLNDTTLETSICVFHQRFSTNTSPKWSLAQPFRYLAHNGELNTIQGNRFWSHARANKFFSESLPRFQDIPEIVNLTGSDSSSLDNMLDLLVNGGMTMMHAIRLLMPPAWQNNETMDADLRAFYEYHSMHIEPWDGPAGLVMTDGRYAVCALDRNGLRPARWMLNDKGWFIVASEIGTYPYSPECVVAKGRLGPGQMLAVDTETGELLQDQDISQMLKSRQPYKKWLKSSSTRIQAKRVDEIEAVPVMASETLLLFHKLFLVSREEREQVLLPLMKQGQEGVGSMGDDTPIAVMSHQVRAISDYFRQQFAQVTNPPIDSIREANVMSLETCVGPERNIFQETPEHAQRIILKSPVLSRSKFTQLTQLDDPDYAVQRINLNIPLETALQDGIEKICSRAETSVRSGKRIIVLNDRDVDIDHYPIPALLATGAIHHRLASQGLRCDANIIVKTAWARDPHHFATLIGCGATAVYPYFSYQVINDLVNQSEQDTDIVIALRNYRRGIAKGLLKILSKMGISSLASYRGAQLFEILGLDQDIVDMCFTGGITRIGGASFAVIEKDVKSTQKIAFNPRKPMNNGGLIKYVHGGEYHAFNPDVVTWLQTCVKTGQPADYQGYLEAINQKGKTNLRDLLAIESSPLAVASELVEPIEDLLKRFDSAGMSLGALSPEAHETLAQAMNSLGGRSNSGEGGEDPARFGSDKNSKIKQIASGRFGVTPHYLVNAEVLQIKIAQGAKPGEGGQLPGGKVNELIARLRYSVPGITLISPPPHHDIYSIEDLAQLIYDLKRVNPKALVSVKLVSEPGIGTIATGVAKAFADLITISGFDGGTAASPISSIRYAGSPWELGLVEVHQALRVNGLRDRVRLQAEGGLKTGLDVIKAAILGAESFGFGTTPMVAMGCKYLRICHLNNCATGVATQQLQLRSNYFSGDVQKVRQFFQFIAEDVRQWLAELGFKRLEDIVGRVDLFSQLPGDTVKQQGLDLSSLLKQDYCDVQVPHTCQVERNHPVDPAKLSNQIFEDLQASIQSGEAIERNYQIRNKDRSIGARISGEVAKLYGNQGIPNQWIKLNFTGTAGQSFGVWNVGGLQLKLEGDANDYVGKGMTGGLIAIHPPKQSQFKSQQTTIIGNTCLYGATGGSLYAAGGVGERFAVRNSGATAVIEGAGDHCCEYMTGGTVVVLGETGGNFAAGMTGGTAFVLDPHYRFIDRLNHELVDVKRIVKESMEAQQVELKLLISDYVAYTHSEWGQKILDEFEDFLRFFWWVVPKSQSIDKLITATRGMPQ